MEKSNARYRFVFIHNLTGGFDLKGQGRGGAEAALFYEWGGRDPDSSMTFASHRPGWELPIHQLLVKHKVNVVFHGHDHFFARQELDGIIYQLVPQPGALHTGNLRMAQEYGYREGTFMNAPAYLRVSVSPSGCLLELIRSGASGNQEVLYAEILK